MTRKPIAFLGALLLAGGALGREKGLVAHYTFDEGQGDVARDASGFNNHGVVKGGAEFVKLGEGFALKFDGKDDFVDCGADPSLAIEQAGTVEFWFRAQACHGGLAAWTPTGAWPDMRLVAAFHTYRSDGQHPENGPLLLVTANGALHSFHPGDRPERDVWHHYAIAFDEDVFVLYKNGVRQGSSPRGARPDLKGVPLWLGKCLGLGRAHFRGLMDDVRIYNRKLEQHEAIAHYALRAEEMGRDAATLDRVKLRVQAIPERGWILVEADRSLVPGARSAPQAPVLEVTLRRQGEAQVLLQSETPTSPADGDRTTVTLDAARQPAGSYEVHAVLRTPSGGGASIGQPGAATVHWPGRDEAFRRVKILNNLVWELLNEAPGRLEGGRTYEFVNPTDRWGHVAVTAELADGAALQVSLDDAPATRDVIVLQGDGKRAQENMRFLAAGSHTISLRGGAGCRVESLRVRAVAELIFQYGHNPHVKPFPKYVPDFAARHILPHVNTLVVRDYWLKQPFAREWTQRGGRLLYASLSPRPPKGESRTIENSADFIAKTTGYTHPLTAGIIADEYGGSCPRCAIDAGAVRKLHATAQFRSKSFYPYAGNLYDGPEGREFMQAVMATGGANVWKRYLPEPGSERQARDFIATMMVAPAYGFREHCPGAVAHLVPCIGYFSAPPEFCDVNPGVNYKTFLDLQFHTIATHPAFFGVRGFMTYGISYTDEEIARWGAKFFRRYGIEGSIDRAVTDPYALEHIANPDFAQGLSGWTLAPAAPDAIRATTKIGFGWHQGRYPRTDQGDTALLMVRSAAAPNRASQQVRKLEPGRLYSLRMYTGDNVDASKQGKHAFTIRLEGVEIIPEQCFTHVFRNYPGHNIPGPTQRQAQWMNFHWRIFRAESDTARLTLSDWSGKETPGGPIGQQLLLNFVQIQPYDPQ